MLSLNSIRVLFLFLPGIITVSILQLFNPKNKKFSVNEIFMYSFIFGVLSYLGAYGTAYIMELFISFFQYIKTPDVGLNLSELAKDSHKYINILEISLNNSDLKISLSQITVSCTIGMILGLIATSLRNKGIIHKKALKLGVSYETGYPNVLSTIYKSNSAYAEKLRGAPVSIKMLDGTSSYQGRVKYYDFNESHIELLLEEVTIFFKNNEKGLPKLYKQDSVYLTLIPGTFILEFYNY